MSPWALVNTAWLPSLSPYKPRSRNCSSLMSAAAATRLRTLTWLEPLNTTPLRFTSITVPSPLIWPWIWLGRALGSLTRFNTAQLACWSKSTVVSRLTLKVSQLRIALLPVCLILTVVWPSRTDWVGSSALNQPAVSGFASTFRPPSARPSGIFEAACRAACRAASWAARWAATAPAVRVRLSIERRSFWLAWRCARIRASAAAPGRDAGALARAAALAASHSELSGRGAASASPAVPTARTNATARASGFTAKG